MKTLRDALSTLTTRGRAFLSAGITCVVCVLILGQKDLLRVGLLLLALPLITAIVTARLRFILSCQRTVVPARVAAGDQAVVSIRLDNPGRIATGLILVEDQIPYVLGSRPRFVVPQLRPKWHREIDYQIRSEVRGRYGLGPLSLRITDPFGFVELSRSFTARTTFVVTPAIWPLPLTDVSGDWSGTGDNRPRSFASAGTEDVTVREYRRGDDLRRVHWRSSARVGELMVRREEQPHQSRATLILDTRKLAHRGSGPASSFEYAVSAIASIGAHLSRSGFMVRLMTDHASPSENTWHDRGISSTGEVEMILDALAVVTPNNRESFSTSGSHEVGSAGLLVTVLGSVSKYDVAALSTLRHGATRALAILLDTRAWTRADASEKSLSIDEQVFLLRTAGWTVSVAGPGSSLASAWRELSVRHTVGSRPFETSTSGPTA